MKRAELLAWRPVRDDEYLKFTRDHLKIGGGDRAAGLVYAVLEFRTYPGGPGDTEFLEIDMPDLLSAMGGWEMNPETARAGIRKNLQTGVFVEGPRCISNTWRLRIDRANVKKIMEMSQEQAAIHFAEIREATPLPIPPRKESSRYAEIREAAQAVGFQGQLPDTGSGNPQSTERNSANPYIGSNYSPNTNKELASSRFAETREAPLEQSIRDAANGLELDGRPIDPHTCRIVAAEIAKVSRCVETIEVEAFQARCAGYAKSRRAIGWGIVVNDTRAAVTRRMEVLLGGRRPAALEPHRPSIEERIRMNEEFIAALPTHPEAERVRLELEELRREVAEERTDRKTASAGG